MLLLSVIHLSLIPNWCQTPFFFQCELSKTRPTIFPNECAFLKIMLHIWATWSDNLSLFNDLSQTVHHTWCSQRQQLCRILMDEFLTSVWAQSHLTHWPLHDGPTWLFPLWKTIALPLLVSFHPTLCLLLLTSLTYSSKWTWHLSHCLTKVCVWAVFREVRPSLGHTNQLQTKALDRWVESLSTPPGCTLAWGSNLLHPLWPSPSFILVSQMGLASIPGHWSLPGSLRGRIQSAAALPREPPECAFCQPRVC